MLRRLYPCFIPTSPQRQQSNNGIVQLPTPATWNGIGKSHDFGGVRWIEFEAKDSAVACEEVDLDDQGWVPVDHGDGG